jgi:hypothetical protein
MVQCVNMLDMTNLFRGKSSKLITEKLKSKCSNVGTQDKSQENKNQEP